MPETLFKVNLQEYMLPGQRACQGCALSLAFRYILKALREDTIYTVPACCLTVLCGLYPTASVAAPILNCAFASTAASASGLVAGLRALNRNETTVVAIAGDGGTFDIGLQALSGAVERETDFIFVCYDNEAYMNTGTQRSSATPLGATTSTTPLLTKRQQKKDMVRIMAAHDVPYISVSSPVFPLDLYDKFVKAKRIRGSRYMQVSVPCPPGWGYPPKDSVRIGQMAIEAGIVVLCEIEEGRFRFTGRSKALAQKGKRVSVNQYLDKQQRFRRISEEQREAYQQWVDKRWEEYLKWSQD